MRLFKYNARRQRASEESENHKFLTSEIMIIAFGNRSRIKKKKWLFFKK